MLLSCVTIPPFRLILKVGVGELFPGPMGLTSPWDSVNPNSSGLFILRCLLATKVVKFRGLDEIGILFTDQNVALSECLLRPHLKKLLVAGSLVARLVQASWPDTE